MIHLDQSRFANAINGFVQANTARYAFERIRGSPELGELVSTTDEKWLKEAILDACSAPISLERNAELAILMVAIGSKSPESSAAILNSLPPLGSPLLNDLRRLVLAQRVATETQTMIIPRASPKLVGNDDAQERRSQVPTNVQFFDSKAEKSA